MGIQFENAVINFTLLHAESVTCRKDTLSALDQMKQRVMPYRLSRQDRNLSISTEGNAMPTYIQTQSGHVDTSGDEHLATVSNDSRTGSGNLGCNGLTCYLIQREKGVPSREVGQSTFTTRDSMRKSFDDYFQSRPTARGDDVKMIPGQDRKSLKSLDNGTTFPHDLWKDVQDPGGRLVANKAEDAAFEHAQIRQRWKPSYLNSSSSSSSSQYTYSSQSSHSSYSSRSALSQTSEKRLGLASQDPLGWIQQDANGSSFRYGLTSLLDGRDPVSTGAEPRNGRSTEVGRPCRANDYWGICRGAWATREKAEKGMMLRLTPTGMYSSKEIWECKDCSFHGLAHSAPHPLKQNRRVSVMDTKVYTAKCGIRYRWIFLAKSHVKTKPKEAQNEISYGCILCLSEGYVTNTYDGSETLMHHIALVHVQDMTHELAKKMRCIQGRIAGPEEDWDINVPLKTTEPFAEHHLGYESEHVRRDDSFQPVPYLWRQDAVRSSALSTSLARSLSSEADGSHDTHKTRDVLRNTSIPVYKNYDNGLSTVLESVEPISTDYRDFHENTLNQEHGSKAVTNNTVKPTPIFDQPRNFGDGATHTKIHIILGTALDILLLFQNRTLKMPRVIRAARTIFTLLPNQWFSEPKPAVSKRIQLKVVVYMWFICLRSHYKHLVDCSGLIWPLQIQDGAGCNQRKRVGDPVAKKPNNRSGIHLSNSVDKNGSHSMGAGTKNHADCAYNYPAPGKIARTMTQDLHKDLHPSVLKQDDTRKSESGLLTATSDPDQRSGVDMLRDNVGRVPMKRNVVHKIRAVLLQPFSDAFTRYTKWSRAPVRPGYRRIEWSCVSHRCVRLSGKSDSARMLTCTCMLARTAAQIFTLISQSNTDRTLIVLLCLCRGRGLIAYRLRKVTRKTQTELKV
jgi:hypothetical protein